MSGHRSVVVSDIVEAIHKRNASNPALEGSTEAEIISSVFETISEGGPKADLHEIGQQAIAAIEHGVAFKVLVVTEDSETGEVRYNVSSFSTEKGEARLMMNVCLADLGMRTTRQIVTVSDESGSDGPSSVRGSLRQASHRRMCNEMHDGRDANVASGSGMRSSRGDGRASVPRSRKQPELSDVLDDCVRNYGKARKNSSENSRSDDGASEEEDGNEEVAEERAADFIEREVSAIKDLQQVHALQHAEGQQRYSLRNRKVEAKTCALSNDRLKAKHFDSDDESEHEYGLAYRNCDGKKKMRKDVDAKAAAKLLKEDHANAKKLAAKQKGRERSNRKYAAPKGKGRKARSACKTNAARHAKRKKSVSSSNSSKDRQKHNKRKTKKVLLAKRNNKSARSSSDDQSCETKKKTPAKRKVKSARASSSEQSCDTKKKTPAKRKVKSARASSSEQSCETKKKTPAKRKVKPARASSSEQSCEPKKKTPAKRKVKSARASSSEQSCEPKKKTPAKRKVKPARASSSEQSCKTKKKTPAKRTGKSSPSSSTDEQPYKKKPKKLAKAKGKGKRVPSASSDRSSSNTSKRSSYVSSEDCNDSCSYCSTESRPDDSYRFIENKGGMYHCKACGTQLDDFIDRFSSDQFLYQEVDDVIMISDDDASDQESKSSKKSSKKSGHSRGKSNRKRGNRNTRVQDSQEEARVRDLLEAHSKVSKSTQSAHFSNTVDNNLDVVEGLPQEADHQIETEFVPDLEVAAKSNADADQDGNMLTGDLVDSTSTDSESIQKPQNEMFVDALEGNKRERSLPHQIPHPLTPALPDIPHHLMMNTQETLHGAPGVGTHSLINNTDISDLMTKRSNELKEKLGRTSGSRVAAVDGDVDASIASDVVETETAAKAEGDSLSCTETVADGSTGDGNSADSSKETTGENERAICDTTDGEEKVAEEETVSADSEDGSGNTEEDGCQAEGNADSVN